MSSHKIPKEDFVYQIVRAIVRKRGFIETQRDLGECVQKRLKQFNEEFVISPTRCREIAVEIPNVQVKTKTRKSSRKEILKKCPVCESRLDKIYGTNLKGKKVHMGYECHNCGFSSDLTSTTPMKYTFIWRG